MVVGAGLGGGHVPESDGVHAAILEDVFGGSGDVVLRGVFVDCAAVFQ